MHVKYEATWNFHLQLNKKGVRLRAVTEVTPDNISYVKKLMEVSELRHLAGVKCNFGIVDRKVCLFHSISQRPTTVHDAISPISPTAIVHFVF